MNSMPLGSSNLTSNWEMVAANEPHESAGHDAHGHPHDALAFLLLSFIFGVSLTALTMVEYFKGLPGGGGCDVVIWQWDFSCGKNV